MRYTNFTETTQSLEALKFKGSLFLKSSERNLKETAILFPCENFGLPWIFYKAKLNEFDSIWDQYLSGSKGTDVADININCPTPTGCISVWCTSL